MNFIDKYILLISPEPWGNSHVSKHHYAKELSKYGAKVYFLNRPSDTFKMSKIQQNLYLLDYKPLFRGLHKLPAFLSAYAIRIEVKKLEKLAQVQFDVIWNFDTSRFFNLSKTDHKLRICHIVDMAENIQRPLLATTSDICFCTSDFIKKELIPFNSKVFKIHHGYQITEEKELNTRLKNKAKYQVGVVGNLSRSCLDWETLLFLIDKYPDNQYNFVGSYSVSNLSNSSLSDSILYKLQEAKNVSLHGSLESSFVPSFLKKMDVLLCVYKIENESDLAQHSNLHKIMEYMGSGKISVSTWVDEYRKNQDLLKMAKTREELIQFFDEVVRNLDFYNNQENQNMRKEFANYNTYKNQIIRIEEIINEHVC